MALKTRQIMLFLLILLMVILPEFSWTADQPKQGGKQVEKSEARKRKPARPLLQEGFSVTDRKAKLYKLPDDNRWFLFFEPFTATPQSVRGKTSGGGLIQPDKKRGSSKGTNVPKPLPEDGMTLGGQFVWPMEILPGKWLTAMTRVTANKINLSITFRIWGEVTTYRGRNFILPNLVATESLFGAAAGKQKTEKKRIGPSTLERALGETSGDKRNNAKDKENIDKLQLSNNLRQILLALPRTKVLDLPTEVKEKPGYNQKEPGKARIFSTGRAEQNRWKDGSMMIDREGRLMFEPQEGHVLFVFESAGVDSAQTPITIHPNQYLEYMEDTDRRTSRKMKFRVTGQISKHQGKDFVLLRKVLITHDSDNLEK